MVVLGLWYGCTMGALGLWYGCTMGVLGLLYGYTTGELGTTHVIRHEGHPHHAQRIAWQVLRTSPGYRVAPFVSPRTKCTFVFYPRHSPRCLHSRHRPFFSDAPPSALVTLPLGARGCAAGGHHPHD
eukprot:655275-Prorocentrum_minimum.AAC.1